MNKTCLVVATTVSILAVSVSLTERSQASERGKGVWQKKANFNSSSKVHKKQPHLTKSGLPFTSKTTTSNPCERARSIIAGYAFENVLAKTCEGTTYNFEATRGGDTFLIEISPLNGDLTRVEKLDANAKPPIARLPREATDGPD